MKTFLINIVTTCLSAVICIGIIEFGMRLYYYGDLAPFIGGPKLYKPDEQAGFVLNPNLKSSQQRVDFIVPVTTNSLGLRGPEVGKKGDKIRIAVLGDSHVFGSGLADNETLPAQLELFLNKLAGSNRFEVVNAGSPAHNTVQELVQIRRLADKIDADLWIFGFTAENDIQFNTAPLRKQMTRGPRRPVASLNDRGKLQFDYSGAERYFRKNKWRLEKPLEDRPWYENTAVYQRGKIAWKTSGGQRTYDPNIVFGWPYMTSFSQKSSPKGWPASKYVELWSDGWAITKALILEIRKEATAKGAKFVMVSMPSDVQVQKDKLQKAIELFPDLKLDIEKANRDLATFGGENDIQVFDILTPLLAARNAGVPDLHYTLFDSHFKAPAHKIMGEALAKDLLASKLLPAN